MGTIFVSPAEDKAKNLGELADNNQIGSVGGALKPDM
jgi:hypothetical protein